MISVTKKSGPALHSPMKIKQKQPCDLILTAEDFHEITLVKNETGYAFATKDHELKLTGQENM